MTTHISENKHAEFLPVHIPTERWKDAPGLKGRYEVSDFGRVRALNLHLATPRMTYPSQYGTTSPTSPLYFSANQNNQAHRQAVHTLVLEAFVGPCPDGHLVKWLDGDKRNNRLQNLRWVRSKLEEKLAVKEDAALRAQMDEVDRLDAEDTTPNTFPVSVLESNLTRERRSNYKTHLERYIEQENQSPTEVEDEMLVKSVCCTINLPHDRHALDVVLHVSSTEGCVSVQFAFQYRGQDVCEEMLFRKAAFGICAAKELREAVNVFIQYVWDTHVLSRQLH